MIAQCLDHFSFVVSKKPGCHFYSLINGCCYIFEYLSNQNSHIKNKYKCNNRVIYFLIYCLCFTNLSCKDHSQRRIERSFYYWKSIFRPSDTEKKELGDLHINTLYIKFFDVDWNDHLQQAEPKAIIRIDDTAFLRTANIKIIPVIFITNECLYQTDSSQINMLADKISVLFKSILSMYDINNIPEIQFDCDWSASTSSKYFSLLKIMKLNTAYLNTSLSCTIRMHQVKYASKAGVPPVDKGLIMCYNMGNLKDPNTRNSILQSDEVKKYIGNLSSYPLKLDVAFPLFEWCVLFRNNEYKGLIENTDILNCGAVEGMNNTMHFVLRDTLVNGISLKKDDIIRYEKSDYNEIMQSAALIHDHLKTQDIRLSLFHLDSVILSKYPYDELENIYNSLR